MARKGTLPNKTALNTAMTNATMDIEELAAAAEIPAACVAKASRLGQRVHSDCLGMMADALSVDVTTITQ